MTDKPSIEKFTVNGAQVWVKSNKPWLKEIITDALQQHEPGDDVCPGCGAHMQATHHPLCQGQDGTKDEADTGGDGPSVVDIGSL